ncbi:MAG: hypothetical protein KDB82_01390 [Planctomycetes bacterium]|nr:hypothetical protein [Planctomycetota bacterium]
MAGETAPVGAPLIEQDAEYLSELLRRHGITARLSRTTDAGATGRTWQVTVASSRRAEALAVRANEFNEPRLGEKPRPMSKARRRWGRAAFLGVAGLLMGLRVGVKLRGGPVVTVLVAAGLCLLAVAASMLLTGTPKNVEETSVETPAEEPEDKKQPALTEDAT